MSMYYSPELVRALMQQRIFEAKVARLGKELEDGARVVPAGTLVSRLSRLMVRRPAASTPVACPNC
jgi:hypothetical protein